MSLKRSQNEGISMQRLFVGIDPPESIKQLLLSRQGGVSAVRWQSLEQMHLTLRFVGEVDRHTAQDVAAAVNAISFPPFSLALSGAGTFDKHGKIHTLYAGVTPDTVVRTLHNKVDTALTRIGIAPEKKNYLPHITLARLNQGSGDLAHFMAREGGLSSPAFAVTHFCLYASTLTRDAAIYTILERYPLR
jgi:RNA 2',3'-cyclic 3'-phosphodiesterase